MGPFWTPLLRASRSKESLMERTPLALSINFGQVEDQGEDSDPIANIYDDGSGLVAVFDGMGGAGSTPITLESGETRSSAYVASRHTRDVVENYFNLKKSTGPFPLLSGRDEVELELRNTISEGLRAFLEYIGGAREESKLKSKLIKNFPTTMALLYYEPQDKYVINCWSIWAGDSRTYVMTSHSGLQQLSIDETTASSDAMGNLKDDSPLSNYINADSDFTLNSSVLGMKPPMLLISASDGCFQYYRTPMHFEYVLLQTLGQAESMEEWESLLHVSFKEVAADDVSLSVIGLGWIDFREMKRNLKHRERWIFRKYIKRLDDWDIKIRKLDEALAIARRDRDRAREEFWGHYRDQYEEYIDNQTKKI